MTGQNGVTIRWSVLLAAAAALAAAGAVVAWMIAGGAPRAKDIAATGAVPAARADEDAADSAPAAVAISLGAEVLSKAGIAVGPVRTRQVAAPLRLPGVIRPDGYREVAVTPLVAGRVTRVSVLLGDTVRSGQVMARVFSPELADAITRHVSERASLEAQEQELRRVEKLVEIGAASRQELERVSAEHTALGAAVEAARSRAELLGAPASALDAATADVKVLAEVDVPAPIAGVVTERTANVGLNVDAASRMFTVVDLATVWVIADVFEHDLSRVRIGDSASVTVAAWPDRAISGRITYIDPEVRTETRTARLRVEVPNRGFDLRLGMYADVVVGAAEPHAAIVVPRRAVQTVGNRHVVYVADAGDAGEFVERDVRLGEAVGNEVEVLSGLAEGDRIVTEGSFFVRAEIERLGLRPAAPAGPSVDAPRPPAPPAEVQTARVTVGTAGYEPARVTLRAGVPARITFVRTTDATCGTEVVFPSLAVRRDLPLDEPVTIEFTPSDAGDIAFTCGMDMLRGTVVVK